MSGLSTLQEIYWQNRKRLHPSLMDYETINEEKHYGQKKLF